MVTWVSVLSVLLALKYKQHQANPRQRETEREHKSAHCNTRVDSHLYILKLSYLPYSSPMQEAEQRNSAFDAPSVEHSGACLESRPEESNPTS